MLLYQFTIKCKWKNDVLIEHTLTQLFHTLGVKLKSYDTILLYTYHVNLVIVCIVVDHSRDLLVSRHYFHTLIIIVYMYHMIIILGILYSIKPLEFLVWLYILNCWELAPATQPFDHSILTIQQDHIMCLPLHFVMIFNLRFLLCIYILLQ